MLWLNNVNKNLIKLGIFNLMDFREYFEIFKNLIYV